MKLLLGVGNEYKGDDGVGPYVAKRVNFVGWKGVNCSTTPENFTGLVKRERPELLVIVDAAEMGLEPGEIRVIPREKVDELTMSTHYIPLSILIRYLEGNARKILFIGIQPKKREEGSELSKEVREGAERLLEFIKQDKLDNIKRLS